MSSNDQLLANVRQYYGRTLQQTADLQTGACCSTEAVPRHIKPILAQIEDEIITRFYGCGSPLPPALAGRTVLDLGCGAGRDVYVAAALVGAQGRVIGVDMTEEQLDVARRHRESQCRRFGYDKPNVDFRRGYIEDLESAGVAAASVDVVISNCVVNLSPRKDLVFREIMRVLKPGGELYFADVFCDRRLPAELMDDPVLHGECLAGAMYAQDFRRLLAELGCQDHRVVTERPFGVDNPEIAANLGSARFVSRTVRAFKLPNLEDRCEDYGQAATYLGSIPECPQHFRLDDHHVFETGRAVPVCGNTAAMLGETRLGEHFRITGDGKRHFGIFGACAPAPSGDAACC